MRLFFVVVCIFSLLNGISIRFGWALYFSANKAYIIANLCQQKSNNKNTCQGACFLKNKYKSGNAASNYLVEMLTVTIEAISNIESCFVAKIDAIPLNLKYPSFRFFFKQDYYSFHFTPPDFFV